MKIKFIIILILLSFALYFFLRSNFNSETLSDSQKQIIDLYGNPSQFILTYLPQGEKESNLARYEIWYYPELAQKITFLSGKLIDTQDFQLDSEEELSSLSYLPWDFEFFNSYQDLVDMFGKDDLFLVDLPAFNDEGLVTYSNGYYVFVLEDNYLTYVQTLAFDPSIQADQKRDSEPNPTSKPEPTSDNSIQNYSSSDLGFSMNYPNGWFLRNGVLSNYDTDYLFSGASLPDQMLKCDFIKYSDQDLKIKDKNQIYESDIKISQASIEEESDESGMGFGDNVIFLFEKDNKEPMALVCFIYSSDLENDLLESIKTFKFL